MTMQNLVTPLNSMYLLDKSADDTHSGVLTNAGNIIAQGGLLSTVGDAVSGSQFLNPRISCYGRHVIVPFYYIVPKIGAISPYYPQNYTLQISVPYLFGVEPMTFNIASLTYDTGNCSTATVYGTVMDVGSGGGPYALVLRVACAYSYSTNIQPIAHGTIYVTE